jgi:transcriptional regulator with XRE-family HTH domain
MAGEDARVLFGRRVRQLRKELGVSQEAFAHRVRIDRSYFGSIERGERNVSLDNICLIAEGLGVPPHELLRFDEAAGTQRGEAAPAKPRPASSPKRPRPGRK